MVRTDVAAERAFDDEQFATSSVHASDRCKVVFGYFEPGQFIPVHAPGSDLVVDVKRGRGLVRDGDEERRVESGDVVAVPAGEDRGIRADAGRRLEALLVTAPPPTDAEHDPVRAGIRRGEFEPGRDGAGDGSDAAGQSS